MNDGVGRRLEFLEGWGKAGHLCNQKDATGPSYHPSQNSDRNTVYHTRLPSVSEHLIELP